MLFTDYVRYSGVFCLLLSGLLVGCGSNPSSIYLEKPVVPTPETISLSRNYELYMEFNYPHIRNDYIDSYLSDLVDALAASFSDRYLTFKIVVVDAPVVNAFAMPSGKIYITKLLLKSLKTEAELVSIISHEIGHIIAGHTEESLRRGDEMQRSLQRMSEYVEQDKVMNVSALFSYAVLQGFSREQELEADEISLVLLDKNQYPASALQSSLKKIYTAAEVMEEKPAPDAQPMLNVFSSHPSVEIRLDRLAGLIDKSKKKAPVAERDQEKFKKLLTILENY